MNVKQTNDFLNEVAKGLVPGKEGWNKFGEAEVAAGSTATTLWSGASTLQTGLYIYPDYAEHGTAVKMRAKSDNAGDTDKYLAILGLDKHKKQQSEVLTLDGTNYVETAYEYLRVFRMICFDGTNNNNNLLGSVTLEELAGGNNYIFSHIEDGGLEINQTEMALYTVPAGHKLTVETVTVSPLDTEPVKIWPAVRDISETIYTSNFAKKLGWNINGVPLVGNSKLGFVLDGEQEFEIRGIATTNKTADIAVNLFGQLDRENSVPVDLENFAVTAGEESITVSWDEQTPAETQDLKGFVVTWSAGGVEVGSTLLSDPTSTGMTIDGLTDGVEYTVTAKWVGYDNRESTIESDTATPGELPATALTLGNLTSPVAPMSSADYVYSTDESTWNTGTGVSSRTMRVPAVLGNTIYAAIYDPDEVADGQMGSTVNGTDWTYDTSGDIAYVTASADALYRVKDSAVETSTDVSTWVPTTGSLSTATMLFGKVEKVGTDYVYYYGNKTTCESADGIAWTDTAATPTNDILAMASDGTDVVVMALTALSTAPTYEVSDDKFATSPTAGTSTISGTALASGGMAYFSGKYWAVAFEDDQSGSYLESSSDGITWSAESAVGTGIMVNISAANGKGYVTTYDGANDDTYVTIYDGSWGTPQLIVDAGGVVFTEGFTSK